MEEIVIKKGKETPILFRHHWVFSGAVQHVKPHLDGSIVKVVDYKSRALGYAYVNSKSQIYARMLMFGGKDFNLDTWIIQTLQSAYDLRKTFFNNNTDSYRLINGESDMFPGLVVDKYNDVLVMQVSTLGVELMRDKIINTLVSILNPKLIYERSDLASRRHEGLESAIGVVYGDKSASVPVVKEYLHKMYVDVINGHKTGYYLDQMQMRKLLAEFFEGKSVLNLFAYTAGFSIPALKSGATYVKNVDISKSSLEQAKSNYELNGLHVNDSHFIAQDVFDYLDSIIQIDEDIVIVDPPAFVKNKNGIKKALGAYEKLNRLAISKMKKGNILFTFSCSYHMKEEMFHSAIKNAAKKSGTNLRIIQKHRHSYDHVKNIYHDEQDYLKSLVAYID